MSTTINGISNIDEANAKMIILFFNVIERFVTKSSMLFLYKFVDTNHSLNLSDPREKQASANSKNGVVGRIGNITPIPPIPAKIKPKLT